MNAPAKAERVDVVVAGAGVAGLTAAWALRDRDVVVLEAADRIGGRVRADTYADAPYHLGAQYIAGRTSTALLGELGVPLTPLPDNGALFLGGKLVHGDALSLARGAGLGVTGLGGLARLARQSARASRQVSDVLDPGDAITAAARDVEELDERSLAELLSRRRPAVRRLYSVLARSLTSRGPDDLSALYALAMLGADRRDGVGRPHRAPGGMRGLLEGYAVALEGRVRTSARVEAVATTGDGVEVTYRGGGAERSVHAQACVVAVPAPAALQVCGDLPTQVRATLARVRYARFLSVALFLREPVWVYGWGIATDLPVVSTLLNPSIATGSGRGTVLSAYASHDDATSVWEQRDDEIADRFVAEIANVFPLLPEAVTGADVRRWNPGYPAWAPGHRALLPALVAPHGRTVLAGDYLSVPSIEGATVSALRAAKAVRSILVAGG